MTQTLKFKVQGSADYPYEVRFVKRSDTNLSAYCDCHAGENGTYCKHRFMLMEGVIDNLVSKNADKLTILQEWLKGTDIEAAYLEVTELEAEKNRITNALKAAKRTLAKAMLD